MPPVVGTIKKADSFKKNLRDAKCRFIKAIHFESLLYRRWRLYDRYIQSVLFEVLFHRAPEYWTTTKGWKVPALLACNIFSFLQGSRYKVYLQRFRIVNAKMTCSGIF